MAIIRAATLADAEAIAGVHVSSWRTTYKGLMPEEYLAGLSAAQRVEQWHRALTDPQQRNFIFVAEIEKEGVVGFVASGEEREGRQGYSGEIYALYILAECQGRGLGRLLYEAAVSDLKQRGHASFFVWVLAENPSRGFYERMGGKWIDEKEIEIGGVKLKEVAYGWRENDG